MSTNNFYVYIFLRGDKPGIFNYGDGLYFDYQPFYVGKGINDRIKSSLKDIKNNSIKSNIINKIHQDDMEIKSLKIKENLSESEAFEFEKYVISKIGRITEGKGPLSNMVEGGQGYSDVPVLQYGLDGVFIKEFSSVGEAVANTGVLNVGSCCRGIRKTAGKFIWRYKKDGYVKKIPIDFIEKMMHFGNYEREVIQMDIEGNFINEFKSIKEAAESTKTHNGKIVQVCKGQRKSSNGFKWKYKN
jgi:hypothetical protein